MARVLVVDDERNVRRSFSMFLTHGGHTVEAAADVDSARDLLAQQTFDVVLCDIVLPGTGGISLLQEVSRKSPEVKFILVTGQPSVDTAAHAVRAGAFAYLRKPVSGSALLEVVNSAAAVKSLQDENRRLMEENRRARDGLARALELRTAEAAGTKEALLASEARLRTISANFPGCIIRMRTDREDRLRFTFLGEGCRGLMHLDPEEVIFDPSIFVDQIHTDDRDEFETSRLEAARSMSEWVWEGRICPPGRDPSWLRFASNPSRASDDSIDWDGVVIDVTENRRLQAELMLSDRMASVGSLASGLAHEVNNPLTVVLANLEIISAMIGADASRSTDERGETSEIAGLLEDTLSGVERIREVISSLNGFSPYEADVTLVDLQKLLDDVLRLAAPELRHRARVVRNYVGEARVMGPPAHLSQLFLNLVLNAAQAISEGDAESNEVRVSVGRHIDGGAIVSISDTGKGMSAELQRRVFDPFVTTWESSSSSSGLGLYIAQSIVTSLGGKISVSSRPGRGTTIEVVLPRQVEAPRARPPDTPSPRPILVPRGRVLVIDDDPGIRRTLLRVLAEHDVETVASGREGLVALRIRSDYDVVFCDLLMPEMTGMDLYETIKADNPQLASRFVFMTGGAFTPRAAEFIEGAVGRAVSKPFDIAEIRSVLNDLLIGAT